MSAFPLLLEQISAYQHVSISAFEFHVVDSPRPVARSPWSISAFCFPNFCFEHEFQHVSFSAFEFPGASHDGVFRAYSLRPPSSILATSPARLYQLGVSDDMTHSAQQGYRRHRRRRLRRFFRVLLVALLFTALVCLTVFLLTKPHSSSSPGPDVSDDSAVQFK